METMTRAGLLSAGRAFTDDGKVHEHRGLKGRNKGRPNIDARARRPTRRVPIPPELVALLREHIARSGPGPVGRLFRSENGNPIQPSTWWHVWQKTPPLLHRPYDPGSGDLADGSAEQRRLGIAGHQRRGDHCR